MDKLSMKTPNLELENIERIEQLFPNCVAEAEDEEGNLIKKVDFDLLRSELGDKSVSGLDERYRLDWPGKRRSILKANTPITKTLRPVKKDSVDWDNTSNVYIEGDNFEALKILQESYLGKIKMIYIDPPYNTGNDFIYKDDYSLSSDEYKEITEKDEKGNFMVRNTETNGKYHSDWLSMMYERLKISRDLLSEDGVIFISIDDNEVDNLKKICDEIFGEKNYEADFHIKVRHEKRILREDIRYQLVMEHALCYRKDTYTPNRLPKEEKESDGYEFDVKLLSKPSEILEIGGYKIEKYDKNSYEVIQSNDGSLKRYSIRGSLISQRGSASEFYELNLRKRRDVDGLGTLYKVIGMGINGDGLGYRYIGQPENENIKNGYYFQGKPLVVKENKGLPFPNFYDFVIEANNVGKEGDIEYKNGKKPIALLNKFFEISGITNDKDALILDYFSGSASTAHAVMDLNSKDNGNRKYIMVQIPDPIENSVNFASYNFKEIEGYTYTICDIGKERIRRSGKIIKEETGADIDYGFRVYKVDESCMKDVYYHPKDADQKDLGFFTSNIKEDRTPEDLLTQVILNCGLTLDLPIEEKNINGNKVFYVAGNSLVACFDDNIDFSIIDEIAKDEPIKLVFRDSCFGSDADRINVENKVKRLSSETIIKVI